MSAFSDRRSLAALAPSLVPCGRGTEAAARGMVAAITAVAAVATAPSQQTQRDFWMAVNAARANPSSAYSHAFLATAWQAIDELREAAEGTDR